MAPGYFLHNLFIPSVAENNPSSYECIFFNTVLPFLYACIIGEYCFNISVPIAPFVITLHLCSILFWLNIH